MDLTISGRPKETPIWQLEQRKRCNPCSTARLRLYARPFGRLRRSKVTTKDGSDPWYLGDQRNRD